MLVFKGKKSLSEIKRRRDDFQSGVNKISGNEYLQFTCVIWMPNVSPPRDKQDNVLEIASDTFLYLDLEFIWNADRELEYQVHQKPNKKLKYLNKGSNHTNATLKKSQAASFTGLQKLPQ